jgi:hypothetical protein
MQSIPISLAASDMVLAREVRKPDNPDGPPICGKGIVLSESLIARLKEMGVQSITVSGHPVAMDGDVGLEDQMAVLDRRFKNVEHDPLMGSLKDILRRQISRTMGED